MVSQINIPDEHEFQKRTKKNVQEKNEAGLRRRSGKRSGRFKTKNKMKNQKQKEKYDKEEEETSRRT